MTFVPPWPRPLLLASADGADPETLEQMIPGVPAAAANARVH